jgi:hypothetical protein
MRVTRWTTAGSALAGLALITLSAAPAQALWVRPPTAELKDASGAVNGCTMHVSITLGRFGPVAKDVVSCPARAEVKRIRFSADISEVRADGSLRQIGAPGSTGGPASTRAITRAAMRSLIVSCTRPAARGTHTYLFRARANTKTTTDSADPNPFIGKAGALATITCP